MKHISIITLFAVFMAAFVFCSSCFEQRQKETRVIAVLPVDMKPGAEVKKPQGRSSEEEDNAYALYSWLADSANGVSLRQSVLAGLNENKQRSQFKIVDTGHIDRIIELHKFEASEWSNSVKVAEIGKALNADSIVLIAANPVGSSFGNYKIQVSVSLLDINTMEVLSSKNVIIGVSFWEMMFGASTISLKPVEKEIKKMKLNLR